MTCDRCGENTYVIFITSKHEKICDKCWDEEQKKETFQIPIKRLKRK